MQLMEMILNAQNGQSVQRLARQFGLSQDQTNSALEALMPAFSTGLMRNTADPQGAGAFMEALAGGRHEAYFDDGELAFSEQGIAEGNGILGHLFGSKDVSRAVAERASAFSGIDQSLLKQMLPSIASMLMGAVYKNSTGRLGSPDIQKASTSVANAGMLDGLLGDVLGGVLGNATQSSTSRQGGGILGQIIEGLAGGALSGARPPRRRSTGTRKTRGRKNNPLGDIFEEMLGAGKRPRRRIGTNRRSPQRRGGNPLEDILGDFFGGENTSSSRRKQPQRRSSTRRKRPSSKGKLGDLFGDMFETGGNKNEQNYRQEMEDVFDNFLGQR